jgi:hypothetical protein
MKPTSKELLTAISKLNKLNLNPRTPYCTLASITLGDNKHSDDDKIMQLINTINKKLALSEEEVEQYQADPLSFMGSGTMIGIHNNQKETYRIIRAENFKAYSLFCKNIERIGFNLYVVQDSYLDVLFV